MKIWLIGMMGSGKTSAGELAASNLGVPFADTDRIVEDRVGASIASFWNEHGEAAFRRVESDVVAGLETADGIVATGGGVVMDPANREIVARSGRVVWLDARPEALAARIGSGQDRPLLSDSRAPIRTSLRLTLEERSSVYEELAEHRIPTDELSTEDVAARIELLWTS